MLHFTSSRGYYTVNEKGQIGGGPNKVRHGPGWTMVGIAHTGPGFRWGKLALRFEQFTPAILKATQWRYRTTGTPRFTVIHQDHGTIAVWGGNKWSGIQSMWYED